MGVVAGKIMPRPRGEYDSNALYMILDIVASNNSIWIARKNDIQNIEPSIDNSDTWMLCIDGSTEDTLELKDYVEKHFEEVVRRIESLETDKAEKSVVIKETIKASDWAGSSAPYTNTILVESVKEDTIVELVLPSGMTMEEKLAYQDAQILNGSQTDGSITIKSWGIKPTIDLSVDLIIRGG